MAPDPRSLGIPYDEWRPSQWESVEWARAIWQNTDDPSETIAITEQPTGCHEKGYKVLMYNGNLKAVEDVVVGDLLIGPDMTARRVLELHRGVDEMYRIIPVRGDSFVVNGGHVLDLLRITQHAPRLQVTVREYLRNHCKAQTGRYRLYRKYQNKPGYTELVKFAVARTNYREDYYGFTLDGDHLYLGYDGTVHHNSGKSAFAIALADREAAQKILVLTHTRNLQAQYGDLFPDCHVHYGRSNYPCVHPKRLYPDATAQDCIFGSKMSSCEHFTVCPYVDSKFKAQRRQRSTVNYAYWNAASSWFNPYYLVLDEAHELPDIVLERSGITFWQWQINKYELEPFPSFGNREWDMINGTTSFAPEEQALSWLYGVKNVLHGLSVQLRENITDRESAAESAACEHLLNKVNDTAAALESSINDRNTSHWYIRTDMAYYRGKYQRRLVCKPLTARHDFSRFFVGDWRTVIMSATIGNAEAFAYELGIENNFEYRVVPNRWLPETRPVHILDVPSMGRSATNKNPSLFDLQAERIYDAITDQPREWPGLILVTRKSEAKLLGERLANLGLEDRIFTMPGADGSYTPTEQQVELWEHRKQVKPNSICVSWSLWQGFDGLDERILIIAKAPYPFLGDPFESERMKANGKMFHQRTAWTLEQGLGRTRRGRPQDYDLNGDKAGFVAIADGSWSRVQKYLSESTREAIVK